MYKWKTDIEDLYNIQPGDDLVDVDIQNRTHLQLAENTDIMHDGETNLAAHTGIPFTSRTVPTYTSHKYISDGMSIREAIIALDQALYNIYTMTVTVLPSEIIELHHTDPTELVTVPDAPIHLVADEIGIAFVKISWQNQAINQTGNIIEIQYPGNDEYIQIVKENITVFPYRIQLQPNTSYKLRVKSYNSLGSSAASNVLSITTLSSEDPGIPIPALVAPVAAANAVNDTQIEITWTQADVDYVDYFIVERYVSGITFIEIQTTPDNTVLSFIDTGRTALTAYQYRVTACRITDSGVVKAVSGTVVETTLAAPIVIPDPPTNVLAVYEEPPINKLTLTWVDASTNETGFKIYRKISTDTTYGNVLATLPLSGVEEYIDTQIIAGQSYLYAVTSYNAAGESAQVEIASPITISIPEPPTVTYGVTVENAGILYTETSTAYQFNPFAISAVNIKGEISPYPFTNNGILLGAGYGYNMTVYSYPNPTANIALLFKPDNSETFTYLAPPTWPAPYELFNSTQNNNYAYSLNLESWNTQKSHGIGSHLQMRSMQNFNGRSAPIDPSAYSWYLLYRPGGIVYGASPTFGLVQQIYLPGDSIAIRFNFTVKNTTTSTIRCVLFAGTTDDIYEATVGDALCTTDVTNNYTLKTVNFSGIGTIPAGTYSIAILQLTNPTELVNVEMNTNKTGAVQINSGTVTNLNMSMCYFLQYVGSGWRSMKDTVDYITPTGLPGMTGVWDGTTQWERNNDPASTPIVVTYKTSNTLSENYYVSWNPVGLGGIYRIFRYLPSNMETIEEQQALSALQCGIAGNLGADSYGLASINNTNRTAFFLEDPATGVLQFIYYRRDYGGTENKYYITTQQIDPQGGYFWSTPVEFTEFSFTSTNELMCGTPVSICFPNKYVLVTYHICKTITGGFEHILRTALIKFKEGVPTGREWITVDLNLGAFDNTDQATLPRKTSLILTDALKCIGMYVDEAGTIGETSKIKLLKFTLKAE